MKMRTKSKQVMLVAGLVLFAAMTSVQADTITLAADVTGSVLKYRYSEYVGVASGAGIQIGDANDFTYRGIMEWATSAMPAAGQIASVEMRLDLIAYGSFYTSDNMSHIVGSGTVTESDYHSASLYEYGEIVASGTLNQTISIDVTAQILNDMNNGRSYSSFRLYWPAADGAEAEGRFIGAPQIEITTVPEPATMSLLGMGGLGVLIRRKRK